MQKQFSNTFLDKLVWGCEPHEKARLLRVFGTGLSRKEIASFLNVNPESIRRFESQWNKSPIPTWYFHMLRFLSGDLSIYGDLWKDSKIDHSKQTIRTPFAPYESFTPIQLNAKYSFIYAEHNKKIKALEREIQTLHTALNRYRIVKEHRADVLKFKR